jgi:hypothetical protein
MKLHVTQNRLLRRASAILFVLLMAAATTQAAQDIVKFRFDSSGDAANWTKWWGSPALTITQDPSFDAQANANSGSLKVVVPFDTALPDNQFAIRGALGNDGNLSTKVIDATKYDHLEFDLYWDPSSPTRPQSADFGYFEAGLVPTDFSQVMFPGISVQFSDGFQHIVMPIAGLDQTKIGQIGGLIFKMWAASATDGLTGTSTFWLDNIKLVPKGFITDFDTSAFVSSNAFWNWWGGAARTVQWDGTTDASGDTNSGALKISVTFPGAGADNQYSEGMSLAGRNNYNGAVTIKTASYSALEMDVRWDPSSTIDTNVVNTSGDPQGLGIGLAKPDWGQTWPPAASQPKVIGDGQWHHYSIPLDPTWPDIPGLIFKKYFNNGATDPAGTMTFWVDNIKFIPSTAVIPPPTLSIAKAKKGLNLFFSQPGGQYQRQGIGSTVANGLFWVNNPQTVTYAATISGFPDATLYQGSQAHIILAPNGSGNGPDYGNITALMLDIKANANGTGTAWLRYKTNSVNNNSMMYTAVATATTGAGQLGSITSSNILGTWSLSFDHDTNITVSGPGGVSQTFTMPVENAQLFLGDSMETIFGGQPNAVANTGQNIIYSEIKITSGSDVLVDDKFDTDTADPSQQVDPNLWTRRADDNNGVILVDQDPTYYVRWTLPDSDFQLRWTTNLNSNVTATAPPLTPIANGAGKQLLLRPADQPASDQLYFFLVKPAPQQ